MQKFTSSHFLAGLALLGVAAIWGSTFVLVKDATSGFPVMAFLALRFTLASIVLLPFVLRQQARQRKLPTTHEWRWSLVAGVTYCGGYIFQTFSLRLIDSGRTGFITGLYVILVPLMAWALMQRRPAARAMLGAVLAVVGLALLSNAPGGNPAGDVLALLCAVSFAAQILAVEHFPSNADWRVMSLIQCVCVGGICAALLPAQAVLATCREPLCQPLQMFGAALPQTISPAVWGAALFTGLLATAMALGVQIWAQRKLNPTEAAIIFALESPFSLLFGWLLRGEVITALALLGCGLILTGMLTTTLGGETHEPEELAPYT